VYSQRIVEPSSNGVTEGGRMFWKCTCVGLALLTHWQTYAAALLFLSFSMGSKHLSAALNVSFGKTSTSSRSLSHLVLELGQVAGITVFVSIMCPMMLGLSIHGAWSLPRSDMESCCEVARSFAVLLLIAVVLSRLPILRSPSVFTFVIGAISLVLTVERLYGGTIVPRISSMQLWPGMWFMIALLSIGTALTRLGTMLVVMPSMVMQGRAKRISTLLAYPLAAAFGFIPLFIYCAWLGHQIGAF
jgi:hypothetical protein